MISYLSRSRHMHSKNILHIFLFSNKSYITLAIFSMMVTFFLATPCSKNRISFLLRERRKVSMTMMFTYICFSARFGFFLVADYIKYRSYLLSSTIYIYSFPHYFLITIKLNTLCQLSLIMFVIQWDLFPCKPYLEIASYHHNKFYVGIRFF